MPDIDTASTAKPKPHHALPLPGQAVPRIPVIALGMSLGLFLAVTFILCVGFGLLFPDRAMYESWLRLLPGFTWLSWPSFFG
ncbi:hypothetical protein [Halomonas organivorans]|uniref:Uncharacterized protein n=1 Tax=Halomonas organivorans TaxID=257772 RepID=A0A7W5BWU7_9GAMM|nr:hypothetical protein [Halomonas organivorans]MBB3140289.1 hypothetical protein [Halomonas organivorans]